MYALEISTSERNGVAVISLAGEINSDTAPILESEILPQVRRYNRVILDLAGIHTVSSIGLRKILMLYRAVKVNNGQVLLVGMNDALRGVMWAAGFLNYFIIAESLEMALAAFD
jgi:anti-sigma B factor antagonist